MGSAIYNHPLGRKNATYIPLIVLAFRGAPYATKPTYQGNNRKKYWKKHPKNAPSFEGPKKVAHLWGFGLHYLRCPQPNKHHAGSPTSTKWFERLRGPKTRKTCEKMHMFGKRWEKIPTIFDITDFFQIASSIFQGKNCWCWVTNLCGCEWDLKRILQWSQIQWNLSIAWWTCLMLVVHGVLCSKFHRILRSLILI